MSPETDWIPAVLCVLDAPPLPPKASIPIEPSLLP